jgi:hypothetical protein
MCGSSGRATGSKSPENTKIRRDGKIRRVGPTRPTFGAQASFLLFGVIFGLVGAPTPPSGIKKWNIQSPSPTLEPTAGCQVGRLGPSRRKWKDSARRLVFRDFCAFRSGKYRAAVWLYFSSLGVVLRRFYIFLTVLEAFGGSKPDFGAEKQKIRTNSSQNQVCINWNSLRCREL